MIVSAMQLNIDGWTQLQGYPEFEGDETGVTLTDKYAADFNDGFFGNIPAIKSEYPMQLSTKTLAGQTFQMVRYNVKLNNNGKKALVMLNYVPPSKADNSHDERKPYYYLENGTISVPIGRLAKYKTCWDHYLFLKGDVGTPDFWASATTSNLSREQLKTYMWGKSLAERPTDEDDEGNALWYYIEPTKKAEEVLMPSPIVQECVWYSSVKSAGKAAAQVAKILTPSQTFGVSGGAWLVMSAGVQMDSGRYKVERQFQWAPEWDADFYSSGS